MWPIYTAVVIFVLLLAVAGYFVVQTAKRVDAVLTALTTAIGETHKCNRETLAQLNREGACTLSSLRSQVVQMLGELNAAHGKALETLSDGHEAMMRTATQTHCESATSLQNSVNDFRNAGRELREISVAVRSWLQDSHLGEISANVAAIKRFHTNS